MTLPAGVRGRIVAVVLLLIPLILLLNFVIRPLIAAYREFGDDIVVIREDIDRYRRVIAELPALKGAMSRFEQDQPLAPFLLTGSNPALAAAGLQRLLQDIASQHGARIVSVHVQAPAVDGPLERIAVQARLQVDTTGLRDILYALESGTPYVFVNDLSITVRATRRDASADNLEVRMTLSGLRTPDAQELAGVLRG